MHPSSLTTLRWNNQGQPQSTQFNDVYFSADNGLEESRCVFLQHNHLAERLRALPTTGDFIIGETGFGTGLNFLATWQQWEQIAPPAARLHFISVEKYPLTPTDMAQAHKLWPELQKYSQQLLPLYKRNHTGQHLPCWQHFRFGTITLTLILDDATAGLTQLLAHPHPAFSQTPWQGVDAWFLDGFAPAKNPDMWCEKLFNTLSRLSKPSTTLATFTAAGSVKRGLQTAGFSIKKVPGFGRKREMLTACYDAKPPWAPTTPDSRKKQKINSPWTVVSTDTTAGKKQKMAVIGAGLAGCHTAYALAQQGLEVTLIDSQSQPAQGASGNPQGILYAKLSAHSNMLSDFNLACLLTAQTHYQHFWLQAKPADGEPCGLLQLSHRPTLLNTHRQLMDSCAGATLVDYVDANTASNIANMTLDKPGLYFPYCGWLNPRAVCQWLLHNTEATVLSSTTVTALHYQEQGQKKGQWQLKGQKTTGEPWRSDGFDGVVIANAQDAQAFSQTQWLPTKPIRGQISYLPSAPDLAPLQTVICGEGYIAPATSNFNTSNPNKNNAATNQRFHSIGASYTFNNTSLTLSTAEHHSNQALIGALIPKFQRRTPIGGRAALRCTSPDYLPLVGPVAHRQDFMEDYQDLSRDGRHFIAQAGRYHPGLYINIAHGSRGLAYTPLCAHILAAQICARPLPIPQAMADALNPGRFIIRGLQRKKPL